MSGLSIPILVILAVAICVPFGAWRATTPRLSLGWFLAIHLPIPFIFLLRVGSGHTWRVIPLMLVAAIAGQLLGSWAFGLWRSRRAAHALALPGDEVAADTISR
jgi:hypothetical protein